jgi:hypothetical protein
MAYPKRTTFLALACATLVITGSGVAGVAMVTPSRAQTDPQTTVLPTASSTHEAASPEVGAFAEIYAPLIIKDPTPTPEPTMQPTLQPQPLPTPSPPTTATTVFGIEMESVFVGSERLPEPARPGCGATG